MMATTRSGFQPRYLAAALWTALAVLLGVEAYMALIACGVSLFGFQAQNCPAPAPERAAPAEGFDDLLRRIGDAQARLAERPACRAGELAPLQIPAQLLDPPATPVRPGNRPDSPPSGARQGAAAPACTEPRPELAATVVVLDGSRSMLEPYDIEPARDRAIHGRLDSGTDEQRKSAAEEFERMTGGSSGRRIDAARDAAAETLEAAGETAGAVVFETCDSIESATGPAAAARVRAVQPKGGTPIAAALQRAAGLIPPGANGRYDGNIVLITDGAESCHGDPCAAAAEIKKDHPGVVINVVDVAGWTNIECVARATGGLMRRGGGTIDLKPLVRDAASRRAAPAAPAAGCAGAIEPPR
jgi:hypothetical protein